MAIQTEFAHETDPSAGKGSDGPFSGNCTGRSGLHQPVGNICRNRGTCIQTKPELFSAHIDGRICLAGRSRQSDLENHGIAPRVFALRTAGNCGNRHGGMRGTRFGRNRISHRRHFHADLFCHTRKSMGRILSSQSRLVGRTHRPRSPAHVLRRPATRRVHALGSVADAPAVVGELYRRSIRALSQHDGHLAQAMGRTRKTGLSPRSRTPGNGARFAV